MHKYHKINSFFATYLMSYLFGDIISIIFYSFVYPFILLENALNSPVNTKKTNT